MTLKGRPQPVASRACVVPVGQVNCSTALIRTTDARDATGIPIEWGNLLPLERLDDLHDISRSTLHLSRSAVSLDDRESPFGTRLGLSRRVDPDEYRLRGAGPNPQLRERCYLRTTDLQQR